MSLTIAVLTVFVFAVIIIAVVLLTPVFGSFWWIPVCAGVAATILFAVLFHTWWFVLWGFMLAVAFYLLSLAGIVQKAWYTIVIGVLCFVIVVGGLFVIYPKVMGETNKIKVPDIAQVIPAITEKINSVKPSFDPNCSEAKLVSDKRAEGKVILDLSSGDPKSYSVTIINPNSAKSDETLVIMTDPGTSYDIVYDVMHFSSYRFTGTLEQVTCSAKKLSPNAKYYVYIGNSKTLPIGWTDHGTSGWWMELTKKGFAYETVDTGEGEWPENYIAIDSKDRLIKDAAYGQFWNPSIEGVVVHIQVAKGYSQSVSKYLQGTWWNIPDTAVNVQEHIMTDEKNVQINDKLNPANITLLYCGDSVPSTELKVEGYAPVKWITEYPGWTCTKQ